MRNEETPEWASRKVLLRGKFLLEILKMLPEDDDKTRTLRAMLKLQNVEVPETEEEREERKKKQKREFLRNAERHLLVVKLPGHDAEMKLDDFLSENKLVIREAKWVVVVYDGCEPSVKQWLQINKWIFKRFPDHKIHEVDERWTSEKFQKWLSENKVEKVFDIKTEQEMDLQTAQSLFGKEKEK